nr:hypothetical protein [Tanacetum cinerariifolium]
MHAPLKSHFDICLRVLKYLKLAPRSVSRYCVFINGNLVSWKSKRQATLSNSSAEAEYMSMASTTSEIMWIFKILAANLVMHEKTKHFDIDVHLVRKKVASGLIKTVKVDTKAQVADILTKALGTYEHSYLNSKILLKGITGYFFLIRLTRTRVEDLFIFVI